MLPSYAVNLISNQFFIFSIVFVLIVLIRPIIMVVGSLLARYSKNYRLIVFYYTCVLSVAPWYAFGYGNRGYAHMRLKEYDKAMSDCNRALKLNSNLHWVYNNRGSIHMQAKRYKQALIEYDKSIKLKPDYYYPYINSMHINNKLKNYEQALKDIDAYIAIKGKIRDASVFCSRGVVYMYLKKYMLALQDFDYALKLKPDFPIAYHNKGYALLITNQVQQGFELITRAFTLSPKSIFYNWTFEWCKMCVEQPNDATIERLETLAKLDPKSHVAYISRGVALWLRGNFEAAAKELERAIALESHSEDAYFWAGMAYASMGHDEEALVALREAQAIGVPAVLMTPLYLLEKTQPAFFEKYAPEFLNMQAHG